MLPLVIRFMLSLYILTYLLRSSESKPAPPGINTPLCVISSPFCLYTNSTVCPAMSNNANLFASKSSSSPPQLNFR